MEIDQDEKTHWLEICQQALDTWGIDVQIDVALEEMAELAKALLKLRRYGGIENPDNFQLVRNAIEEIADVHVMLMQLGLIFGDQDITQECRGKMHRLEGRLRTAQQRERKA